MRKLLLAGLCFLVPPSAALAETEFEGALCFTSATAECQAQGWNAGACFGIRYAPRSVGTNGPDTELSLFNSTFAVGFTMQSGNPVSTSFRTVTVAKVARGGYTFPMGFRLATQNPANLSTTTASISMTGVFNNWDEIAGCGIEFRASATRRP